MCKHTSLAYFLDEVRKESLFTTGDDITGLNFKFLNKGVRLIVKRRTAKGQNLVAFIEREDCRECLKTLWRSTKATNTGVTWKVDEFAP